MRGARTDRKAAEWIMASVGVVALLDAGCDRATPAAATTASLALEQARVVDLSHPFDEQTLYWPTSPSAFELEQLSHGETEGGYFYAANRFCTPEHGGTHLDAPEHFGEGKWTASEIPVERLVAPAVVIDVRAKAAADADYRLTPDDVTAFERAHSAIPEGAIVLMWTGWDARWPDRKAYFGDDTPGKADDLHFPSYGEAAARLLIEQRRVGAVGVDTASIDYGPSTAFEVHRIAAANNVAGIENLRGLDEVPATGAWVIALPLKIAGGSGSPVRAVALVPSARP
jgi:kynurenine formamidase